ncbi:Glycosyltransferase, catalytic subunit of cellulose synthase and poly-beta-1,6-N-acetylglucosamine synthase [Ruminococcaceae bacterium YRB3002]|nr:Glycosyltransferase, catalytic subunit of cellulose synthase and poly-beta-1,6-N-acetylglucosamine synthase [Ruminococcaceae bacterium YRB3002]
METLKMINYIIAIIFTLCYSYQFLYVPISLLCRRNKGKEEISGTSGGDIDTDSEYAVLICARNESEVIGDLIDSIRLQSYPGDKVTVFVMADNCTDNTVEVAMEKGAVVYTRRSATQIGKGYALDALLRYIRRDFPDGFEGYFVIDADNVLDREYIMEMHKCHMDGNSIITSYRNSKNYGDNWISAGYSLWFLRESMYLNYPRNMISSSAAVSGTGFFFDQETIDELGGWPFHLLTEDIEFTIDQVCKGKRIAFCRSAVLYDEQPTGFRQSVRQRMRWARGYLQVIRDYGKTLLINAAKGDFSCFDMAMNILPAFILTATSICCNVALGIGGALAGGDITIALLSVGETLFNAYALLFVLGGITLVTEWNSINAAPVRKLLSAFTFPLFMFTYIPIAFAAMFINPGWKPIVHKVKVQVN